ncbi:Acyl-CoA synthetase (NDP forming) [Pseudomonas flavescens]|uniref:Acyl-CoA synthetase (NDP forming) n=1 Tax=Phytopseudomonas flavescens TaxID=29435 RepID=A0A1G7Y452_9GAMM|nr:acetate--CoA ligase family protein [Pseudomonas flavescens]SDG91232.1 Acyl-CoA synthetase (NDP forming) [Pseudomonas flavescens]
MSSAIADALEKVFRPRSVAILGASNDTARISGRALHYLLKAGYQGAIYPVNNKRDDVQGHKAYASMQALPDVPDIALICLPSALLKQALLDCIAKGVGAAVIYAAGFAETGEQGEQLQQELKAIALQGNLRLLGPNCLGLLNAYSGFVGTFSSAFDEELPTPGPVAIVSQSGAYGGHVAYLCRKRNIGIGYWISTGNEMDVDVADCIRWLAEQDDVSVIVAYAEGARDGESFRNALRVAHERRKAVIFMKVGDSSKGAVAAQSHTASLAGADTLYDGLFRQYGVYRARTTQEQVDVAYAASRGNYPRSRRLGIITVSGGFGIQLCDAAERNDLDVSSLPEGARAKLRDINPMGSDDNPCDTTAGWLNDMSLITRTFEVMYADGGYDSIIGSFTMLPDSPTFGTRIKAAIQAGTEAFLDRPTVLCMEARPEVVKAYEDAGFLVYDDSERAARAIGALASLREGFERPALATQNVSSVRLLAGQGMLSEMSAQRVLREVGVPFLPTELVDSADRAGEVAAAMGFPVAMKIVSPDILHKTEIGGVVLSISDTAAARDAYELLRERAAQACPDARVEGVLITPMARKGVETIIGVNHDPAFGPVVMFGLGGIFTELFKDVSFRVAPFDKAEALRMIGEIKGHALLAGFRGKPAVDIDAIAELLVNVSRFAAANADTLQAIDLNPVVALEQGQGAFALDALLIGREA